MSYRRPLLIVPSVPFAWGSIWQVLPAQTKALAAAGATTLRINPFQIESRLVPSRELHRAPYWILPHGALTAGGLDIVQRLENQLGRRRPPLVLMTNGEGARACAFLIHCAPFLRDTDVFIAASSPEASLLQTAFPTSKHILSIGLPVDSSTMKPLSKLARQNWLRKQGYSNNQKILVYAGRLSAQKNVDTLIRSFSILAKQNPKLQLALLGGPDSLGFPHFPASKSLPYWRILTETVGRLGLEKQVRFVGPVSQADLRMWLASADLHLSLTTHYGEDFGYSIAQGMACGAPTLITRWGGGVDFVQGEGAMGIPVAIGSKGPTVDAGLAAKMIASSLQADTNERLRAGALKYYRNKLSFTAYAKIWRARVEPLIQIVQDQGRGLRPTRKVANFCTRFESRLKKYPKKTYLFSGPQDPTYRGICRAYMGDELGRNGEDTLENSRPR